MNPPVDSRAARAGDRAVAIAGFLAILLTGFFGDEPQPVTKPVPVATSAQSTQR